MAYDVDSPVEKTIEEIPYRVIPGEVGNFRNDVFLERAIVESGFALQMGLPCRSAAEHAPDLGQYQTGGPGGDVLYTAAH